VPEMTHGIRLKSLRLLHSCPDLVRTVPFHEVPGIKIIVEQVLRFQYFVAVLGTFSVILVPRRALVLELR